MDQSLGSLASEFSDSMGKKKKTKNKKGMSCLGLRTDLSFILNKQIENPYVSIYTTIVSTDIPHKYLNYSLVSRLFNYTTVVWVYDLPNNGVCSTRQLFFNMEQSSIS